MDLLPDLLSLTREGRVRMHKYLLHNAARAAARQVGEGREGGGEVGIEDSHRGAPSSAGKGGGGESIQVLANAHTRLSIPVTNLECSAMTPLDSRARRFSVSREMALRREPSEKRRMMGLYQRPNSTTV